MMDELPRLSLIVDPDLSCMTFEYPASGIELRSQAPIIQYQESGRTSVLQAMDGLGQGEIKQQSSPLGRGLSYRWQEEKAGFLLSIEWIMLEDQTSILWRWSLTNHRNHHITLAKAVMMACAHPSVFQHLNNLHSTPISGPTQASDCLGFAFPGHALNTMIYLPGWQSWSYGGWLRVGDRFPRSRLRPLTFPMIYDRSRNRPKKQGYYISEMFTALLDTQTNSGLCAGFLGQRQSFGWVEAYVSENARELLVWTDLDDLRLDPGASFCSDWACVTFSDHTRDILVDFVDLAGEINQARVPENSVVGWCSWYDYGQSVSEINMKENIQQARTLNEIIPLDLMQIDDGYQSNIGDWLSVSPRFPSGMQSMAQRIKRFDYQAGLWLAPFLALPSSAVARKNRDWILRNHIGLPINTGLVWNQFGRAFDLTHPGFLEYLVEMISTITHRWGYEYLKLDFLYTGALAGNRYNPRLSRAQALYDALRLIRETANTSTRLVGCGCPLGSGIGIFDYMRIGPDVATTWKPTFPPFNLLVQHEPSLPAVENSIRNMLNRSVLHQRWWENDPDCVTVRDHNSSLKLKEIQSLVTAIGMAGGSLLLSDRLARVSPQRLGLFGMLIPPMTGQMRLDSANGSNRQPIAVRKLQGCIGTWWLIGCFNLSDKPHRFKLSLDQLIPISGRVHILDIWNERYQQHKVEDPFYSEIAAHHVSLFAVRTMDGNPTWVGDKFHISQGLVVKEWEQESRLLRIRMKTSRRCHAPVWLYAPKPLEAAFVNGCRIVPELEKDGLLLFQFDLVDEGVINMHWSEDTDDH